MSKLGWYWHRLRAMSPDEILRHARKRIRASQDSRRGPDWGVATIADGSRFPVLPSPADAPPVVRAALERDARAILAGVWRAFGQIPLQVDDPPRWHHDYLANCDVPTSQVAFRLNHRALPPGSDVKLIWELSRWYQLVRLAQAAFVFDGETAARAGGKCLDWLEDWARVNPPYHGWNWTSALEVGVRLVQFTWIDACLSAWITRTGGRNAARLAALRARLLPAHVWYAWRHQSFGSSANNHLLGELVGVLLATVRWPELERWGAPVDEVWRLVEREVLAQFAPDGVNREQALNYHLFSWEFGWQARSAWLAAGRTVSPELDERLRLAARYFVVAQVPEEVWDYGDSDNAYLSPMFADETRVVPEWHRWFTDPAGSPALEYWCGHNRRAFPGPGANASKGAVVAEPTPAGWTYFPDGGHLVGHHDRLTLRWDLSPLGYLRTAAHGHLDALHVSLWVGGVALLIDPGTGAYYADKELRSWLASRTAHNGPARHGTEWPRRLGPFLWASRPAAPTLAVPAPSAPKAVASAVEPGLHMTRSVAVLPGNAGIEVVDTVEVSDGAPAEFSVRWQFAPGAVVERVAPRTVRVTRSGVVLEVELGERWRDVVLVATPGEVAASAPAGSLESRLAGTVSPGFRRTTWAPFLKLVGDARSGASHYESRFRVVTPAG